MVRIPYCLDNLIADGDEIVICDQMAMKLSSSLTGNAVLPRSIIFLLLALNSFRG
jgi:hypothetical protein